MVVTPRELAEELQAGGRPPVLDVRTAAEFSAGHVPGAVHIPFWMLPVRLADVPARRQERLIVYCGHGPRAMIARMILQRAGFRHVALLAGHWTQWSASGCPVETG